MTIFAFAISVGIVRCVAYRPMRISYVCKARGALLASPGVLQASLGVPARSTAGARHRSHVAAAGRPKRHGHDRARNRRQPKVAATAPNATRRGSSCLLVSQRTTSGSFSTHATERGSKAVIKAAVSTFRMKTSCCRTLQPFASTFSPFKAGAVTARAVSSSAICQLRHVGSVYRLHRRRCRRSPSV